MATSNLIEHIIENHLQIFNQIAIGFSNRQIFTCADEKCRVVNIEFSPIKIPVQYLLNVITCFQSLLIA
jgi:hypothetical protein